ncbi:MAG TPA: DUF488 domain-containing protein [Gemmatimonadaceae bacterium]|nr:DUF488 domain-containing protein [Gemmatimonadaceae bacterium]
MGPDKLFTIGHSTRSFGELVGLLQREGVRHLIDVRAFPASRRYPHFSKESLESSLPAVPMRYTHFPELGGRRKGRADSRNMKWRNAGFRAYADYMETPEFQAALNRLVEQAGAEPSAIMCAEAVPWRCHRTLISDAAEASGVQVFHILDASTSRHTLTSFAAVRDSRVRYDLAGQSELFQR